MYTVLLVDDESTILDALSDCILWQQFGVGTVLTASDGIQALEILSRQTVHLLITDIKMPRMDGLSLLREVRASYPETHSILLTAYGEFEYARQALQLGVENYLLKPLQKEELEETIEKALDNIYANQKISHHLFRKNILLRWANGNITGEELSERANLLGLNLYLPEYCAVCVSPKSAVLPLSGYCKKCAERLSSAYEAYHFIDEHERGIFLIGGSTIRSEELTACFTQVAAEMEFDMSITISIGNTVPSAEQLPESHLPIVSLMSSTDLSSSEMILAQTVETDDAAENKLLQTLKDIFQYENEEKRLDAFSSLASKLFQMTDENINKPSLLLAGSLSKLFAQDFPKQPGALDQLHNRMRILGTLSDQSILESNVVEILEYSYLLYRYYIDQLSPIIQAAINYIHQHYEDNISIQEFCAKNKMSPAYLGYLFKKETGLFFNNYLTQHRICCSIKLLLDTEQKINDIAQHVGFSSPTYYISCFKKQTGMSPIKYRKKQH